MQLIVGQPMSVPEMAEAFEVSVEHLNRQLVRHRLSPSFWVGRTRCYSPEYVCRIYELLCDFRSG